jgi:predicted membrane-bound spermidine synthase
MTLIVVCLALSGFACLVYEVTWAKLVSQWLGVSIHGVALVTAIFLGGLAGGALIGGELADKRRWQVLHVLRAFGVCQLAAAIVATLIPAAVQQAAAPALAAASQGSLESGYLIRALSAVLLLSPPVVLLGASFAAISRVVLYATSSEKMVGWFYALNTFGAFLGVVSAGFFLLPQFGIAATSATAALLNGIAGAIAVALSFAGKSNLDFIKPEAAASQAGGREAGGRRERPDPIVEGANFRWLCLYAALAGGMSLIAEVVWTRWFALVLTSSIYSFTTVLSVVLLASAAGNALAARLARRGNATLIAAAALFCGSCYLLLVLYFADEVVWSFIALQQALGQVAGSVFAAGLLARVIVVLICCFFPALCMGAVFTLLVQAAGIREEDVARRVGKLYAASSLGGLIGTLGAAFFLIPALSQMVTSGIQGALILTVVVLSLMAMGTFWTWVKDHSSDRGTAVIVTGAAGFVVLGILLDLLLFPPAWNKKLMSSGASFFAAGELAKLDRDSFFNTVGKDSPGSDELIFYREGLNSTVTVSRSKANNIVYLRNDGKVEAAVPIDSKEPAPGADVKTQLSLGFVPMLLHKTDAVDALLIGYGSGTTASAMAAFPSLTQLTVCELEAAVLAANSFFRDANGDVLSKKTVNVITSDARYELMSSKKQYDVLVSQPADPWLPGSSGLFTREFWQTARQRLKPDGVICQWVQLYSIAPEHLLILCKTFQAVFPECYMVHPPGAGEVLLVGVNGKDIADEQTIAERMSASPNIKQMLVTAGCDSPQTLKAWTVEDPQGMQRLVSESNSKLSLNTDDRLLTEYALPTLLAEPEKFLERNLALIERKQSTK